MQNQWNKAYAGFVVRLVAYAVDSMFAALAMGMVKLPFSIAARSGVSFLRANFIFNYSLLDVLGYVGIAAYFVLLTYFTHSTLGKMLFRLEVAVKDKEWTFLNVLYRETVGRFLSGILCIGYFVILVQPEKQGFHDMLCDTYVVYKKMVIAPEKECVAATDCGPVVEFSVRDVTEQCDTSDSVPSAFGLKESHPVSTEDEEDR